MLSIIRFFFLFLCLLSCTILLIKILNKKNMLNQKNKIIYIISVIVILQIAQLPIENLIFKYDSLDKAFFFLGKGEFLGSEEGENSSLLISNKDSTNSYIYLRKENNYLSAPFIQPKKIFNLLDEENRTSVDMFKEENTNNYYIIIFTTNILMNNLGENYVTDNNNSTFHRLLYSSESRNDYFYLYSAYVKNIDEDNYYVKINDNEYKIFD